MAESFLKEQLERIRKLTERMSAVESNAQRLADEIAHDRESMHHSPLHEVRDYRTYSGPSESSRESSVRDSSRGKRRR
jgi:hypothetical protein